METTESQHFGSRIKAARTALGISAIEFAQALGVSAPALSQMETGKNKNVSGPVARLMSVLYGISTDYIMEGSGDMFMGGAPQQLRPANTAAEPVVPYEKRQDSRKKEVDYFPLLESQMRVIEEQQKTIRQQTQTIHALVKGSGSEGSGTGRAEASAC